MQAAEFVASYPRTIPAYEVLVAQPDNTLTLGQRATAWGYRFGRLLHDNLSGKPPVDFTGPQELTLYRLWQAETITAQIDLYHDTEATNQLGNRNVLNFHRLNRHLMPFWLPLTSLAEKPPTRWRLLGEAQDGLAFEAFDYFKNRQAIAEAGGGTHVLFEPDMAEKNSRATGVIQEFDVPIVVLDAMRLEILGPNTLLLPAPPQFAQTEHPEINVNFVVLDLLASQAIGVQVTSWARDKRVGRSDSERVVFIDGNLDLNNVMPIRHNRRSSHAEMTSWPGIIAARKMCELQLSGKNRSPLLAKLGRQLGASILDRCQIHQEMQMTQYYAKQLAGNLRVDFKMMANRIGDRINAQLTSAG